MSTPRRPLTVALLGPFGFGNLGDAAIQDSAIAHLRRLRPNLRLVGVSMNPQDTLERHGIPAYAYDACAFRLIRVGQSRKARDPDERHRPVARWRRATRSPGCLRSALAWRIAKIQRWFDEIGHVVYVIRTLHSIDVLLISGGGQLDEFWGGPWRHPFILFKWTLLARLSGVRVLVLSVGAGSVRHPVSRRFLKWTLRTADYVSYRDTGSCEIVRSCVDRTARGTVVPDMAFALPVNALTWLGRDGDRPLTVAVGPLPLFHPKLWPERDGRRYEAYLSLMTDLCSWLLEQNARIVFVVGEAIHDMDVIASITRRLATLGHLTDNGRVLVPPIDSVHALLQQLSRVDIAVCSRFHGALLSLLLHRPVLALSYERKVRQLMTEAGMEKFCVDADGASPEVVRRLFRDLLVEYPDVRTRLEPWVAKQTEKVIAQFDLVADRYLPERPAPMRPL